MAYYMIEKVKINGLLDNLLKEFSVIAPIKNSNMLSFGEVSSSSGVVFTSRNTDKSPKNNFLPQTEVMFTYKGGKINKKEEMKKKRLLFGVRPCDSHSFGLLDKVFLNGNFEDTYYKDKRSNIIIFGMSCHEPQITCFCTSFNLGPFYKENTDVFLVDIGEAFVLEPITDKGEEILRQQRLSSAGDEDVEKIDELKREAESLISDELNISGLKERLSSAFDAPIWNELYLKCVGCGICTFFCPTCYCFDILDEGQEEEGKRVRIWDSCQFPLFTLHGSGHQPRPTGLERFRQRIMHKFNYFHEKFDEPACVGCGRCVINCPVNIDIREVIKQLGGK